MKTRDDHAGSLESQSLDGLIKPAWRVPSWIITSLSLIVVIATWQIFGPRINPLFASYPSEILRAFWKMMVSGQLPTAFVSSMQPFLAGYLWASIFGIP